MAIKKQFSKFIIVGILSTIVNYSFFYFLYEFLAIDYLISAASGFLAGVLAGYGLNKNWTFGVKKTTNLHIYKYYITYSISLILGLLILKLLVSKVGIPPELANLLTIGFTTITNFVGIKFWVFRV